MKTRLTPQEKQVVIRAHQSELLCNPNNNSQYRSILENHGLKVTGQFTGNTICRYPYHSFPKETITLEAGETCKHVCWSCGKENLIVGPFEQFRERDTVFIGFPDSRIMDLVKHGYGVG